MKAGEPKPEDEEDGVPSTDSTLSPDQMDTWMLLASRGMAKAIQGLSEMLGQEVGATELKARRVPLTQAAEVLGGSDQPAAAVYLAMSGSAEGHIVLVYPPQIAFEMVDMAMGDEAGTTTDLGEMGTSVLGEIGNVMAASFLQTIADSTGLDLRVSPPAVMLDMAGAILDACLADIMAHSDEAVLVETVFGSLDRQISGTFLVLPSPALLRGVMPAQTS